jgi:hypothetical protein
MINKGNNPDQKLNIINNHQFDETFDQNLYPNLNLSNIDQQILRKAERGIDDSDYEDDDVKPEH